MPTPFHRFDDAHTANGGQNAPTCKIVIIIFCMADDCAGGYTVRIEGFVDGQWVELAAGPVQCRGEMVRHELPMIRPLARQELAVRAVFICEGAEQVGEDRRIFAVCQE